MFSDRFCFLKSHIAGLLIMICCLIFSVGNAKAQTTSFTYQGRLTDGANPANGNYDLQFALFDGLSGGSQIGSILTRAGVTVSGGIFTVQIDFGVSAFPGADRFLEISVRPSGGGSFTILSPRQQISSTPYAIRTLSAQTADTATTATTATNATQLGGVAASQYVQTNDSRLSDSRSPTAGSSNYIQTNPNPAPQSGANFNITGNGTAGGTLSGNVVNATTQYNIAGNRMLSAPGTNNFFAGLNAGASNSSGAGNAFVGAGAGQANTVGANNVFFGFNAGRLNVGDNFGNGSDNSFFGSQAGQNNNTGSQNAFFGRAAGSGNTIGNFNSFFGHGAGQGNTGSNNSFFGATAGLNNTASGNSFFGMGAGFTNTSGSANSFFGYQAGQSVSTATESSFFGYQARQSTGANGGNSFFGSKSGVSNTAGEANSFFGTQSGASNTIGVANNFFGWHSGVSNSTGSLNSFFGVQVGSKNTTGSFNTLLGSNSDVATGGISLATAIGYNAKVNCDHCMVLGDANDSDLRVGIGTSLPGNAKLDVRGGSDSAIYGEANGALGAGVYGAGNVIGSVGVRGLGTSFFSGDTHPLSSNRGKGIAIGFNGFAAGGYVFAYDYSGSTPQQLYLNHLGGNVGIGTASPDQTLTVNGGASKPGGGSWASFSDERLKNIKGRFTPGLQALMRLQPVRYEYKRDNALNLKSYGEHIGFSAQAVKEAIPEAVSSNDKGYLLIDNDPILWTMLNAIKEQQKEIGQLRKQLRAFRLAKRRPNGR